MKVMVETILQLPAAEVLARVRTPALLRYVAAPLMQFVPLDPPRFPDHWAEGPYRVSTRLFSVVPLGQQTIDISFDGLPGDTFAIRDNGHGELAQRWDHRIEAIAIGERETLYRDTIEIEAGVLTPFVWLFAQVFYRHRQRRWRLLARAKACLLPPLRDAIDDALTTAASARRTGDNKIAWAALERAHVLSQPILRPHLRVHRAMLELAIETGNAREMAGQAVRLVLAPLGHLTGRIPWGNSGRANVSAFEPAPLADDVAALYRKAGVKVRR